MTGWLSRAMMTLAACCLGEGRRSWAAAMQAEYESAVPRDEALRYASGCLAAAWLEMWRNDEGRLILANYALALGLTTPIAAIQIGCALLGFPYLYPGQDGLRGALLEGGEHELLLRGIYQAAVPALSLLLLVLGAGHLRIAWAMLERDWTRVARLGVMATATTATLILFMTVLFLDCSQALLLGGLLLLELAAITLIARRYAELMPADLPDHPG